MGSIVLGKEYFPKKNRYLVDNINRNAIISRLKRIQPGDLLLVKTPGTIYKIGRKITKNIYDHIAVVLYDDETLNIVVPKTIIRPTTIFSKPNRIPLIVRPKWKNTSQLKSFIIEMTKFKSSIYNKKKTIIGILLSTLYSRLGIKFRMKKLDETSRRWICTEAILICLMKAFPEFKAITRLKLDYNSIGFATTNDFLRISEQFPELLNVVY